MKIIIPLICALLAGCDTTPKECEKVVREHVDESKFWIRSIAFADKPISENSCNAVVTAIRIPTAWETGDDEIAYIESKIVVGGVITRYSDGTFTHLTLSNVSRESRVAPVIPTEALVMKIAKDFDGPDVPDDMCSQYAVDTLRNVDRGQAYRYCDLPMAVKINMRNGVRNGY